MNILHIIDHMGFGGAQQLLRDILPELENRINGEVHLYVLRVAEHHSIPHMKHCVSKNIDRYNFWIIFDVLRYIIFNRIDVVHLHLHKAVIVGLIAALFLRVKVIVHEHTNFLKQPPKYRRIVKLLKTRVTVIITDAKVYKEDIEDALSLPSKKIRLVRNWIDHDRFKLDVSMKNEIRLRNGFRECDFIVGFFARLARVKRPKQVVRIAAQLKQSCPEIAFAVVGDGPMQQAMEDAIATYGVGDSVKLLGFLSDVPEFMSMIDVGISTSAFEGGQLAVIEMMSLQKPVITFNVGGLNELIVDGENGFLIEQDNIDAFCDAILRVYNDRTLLQSLGRQARESSEKFSIQCAVDAHVALYGEMK